MIEEKQKIFTAFMDEFVKLNIDQKNNEIIEKQKVILAFLLKFYGILLSFLLLIFLQLHLTYNQLI